MDNLTECEFYVLTSTESSFTQTLPIDLEKKFTHVVVSSISIPKTYYILPNDCDLNIEINSVNYVVTFEKGNYNVNSFKFIFLNKINNLVGIPCQFNMSFPVTATQVQTSKYTFSIIWTGPVLSQPIFSTSDFYLSRVMGLKQNVSYSFVGNVFTTPNIVNFQSYDELLINSDIVANKRKLLQEIFASGNVYNSSIIWQNASLPLTAKRLQPNVSNTYSFSLTTEAYDPVDLNGVEWSFVIMLFKASDYEELQKKYLKLNLLLLEQKSMQ
jgi:hypothetical protein